MHLKLNLNVEEPLPTAFVTTAAWNQFSYFVEQVSESQFRTFAVNVQVDSEHYNQARPQILDREGLGEENERDDDAHGFAGGGDRDCCGGSGGSDEREHDLDSEVASDAQKKPVKVSLDRML